MKQKGVIKKKASVIIWLAVGIILSTSFSIIHLSPKGNLSNFLNEGRVYECWKESFVYSIDDNPVQVAQNGRFEISGDKFQFPVVLKEKNISWNYLYLNISGLEGGKIECDIELHETNKEDVTKHTTSVQNATLKNGRNYIPLKEIPFNSFTICIQEQKGAGFQIQTMQLRENLPVFSWLEFLKYSMVILSLFVILSSVIFLFVKRFGISINLYKCLNMLQDVYCVTGDFVGELTGKLSGKLRNIFRTAVFLFMIEYMLLADLAGVYMKYFKYHIFIYSFCLIIIACLSIEKKLKRVNWNNYLVWGWLAFWILACISDFGIPKVFHFIGYVGIFVFGFLFFVWNNMETPQELNGNFVTAVEISFGITVLFCVICRPEIFGIRYMGISWNPSVFALYLGIVWAAMLTELDRCILEKKSIRCIIMFVLEGCAALFFLWKTQSMGPVLCCGVVSVVWLLRQKSLCRYKKTGKRLVLILIISMILIVPVFGSLEYAVSHVPYKLGTNITFEKDLYQAQLSLPSYVTEVQAAELKEKIQDSRLIQKLQSGSVSSLLSGRDYFYRTYLRNMNLWGHYDKPEMWGKRRLPHNALIGIAYRYGVFSVVPYAVMLLFAIGRTFKYIFTNKRYSFAPFAICFTGIMMSMNDNVEQPFLWLPWLGIYLMMGAVFSNDSLHNEDNTEV